MVICKNNHEIIKITCTSFPAFLPHFEIAPLKLLLHVIQEVNGRLDAGVDLLSARRLVKPLNLESILLSCIRPLL